MAGLPSLEDLRTRVLHEIEFSTQIIRQGHQVTPRFVALTGGGPHTIVLPLPDSMEERARGIRLLLLFLIWKQAHALVGSAELKERNAAVVRPDGTRGDRRPPRGTVESTAVWGCRMAERRSGR